MTKQEFLGYLHDGNFQQLFLECFWNNPTIATPYRFPVGEAEYVVREVAQKGVKIYVCSVATMPDSATRRLIDAKLRKLSHDYLLIFVSNSEPFHHLWSVPVKMVDKRQLVTIEYDKDDQAAFLLEKINAITFSIDAEPTIVDVVDRVNSAFLVNTTDITKKFYQGFRKQHDAFVKGIENITDAKNREWYASVMLNRLMFCYFIQKKRFLNFDENYLGNKLKEIQAKKGKDKFYESFYRSFLKQLFSDGLDHPVAGRSDYFLKKYGRIPYLNGGMFSQHQIEKENKDIDIPDKVFESLFEFFDQWCWHLDNRITASGRDINPDVLGYIFEQYINDRAQMGAYYTKEDITEYIGRNCIVPYVFEAVKKSDAKPFAKEGEIWQLLAGSGDSYIFPAVRKGVDLPLPDYIEKGVDTTKPNLRKRRERWNEKTDEALALPTEIWRETVARRQRCEEIRRKITNGEITDIHDFITYNLDIRAFAEDVIRKTDDHKLVRHFYNVIREVTVLDPTCGSGAFLFAALNILEPLYEACLDRMEEFHAKNPKLFKEELDEIVGKFRSNQKYFIYKNIILRNLYGVDIMHEATEIARLRLFLKMVAVVDVDEYDENLGLDPLPDIDFNIRCGNTLVGYATEEEIRKGLENGDMFAYVELKDKIEGEMQKVSMAYDFFRREQLNLQGDHQQLVEAKQQINQRLASIRNLLDDQLYDRHSGKKKAQWLTETQPFHWYTEFYPIMHGRGGFDVIIGNPPYVEYTKKNASTHKAVSDLYSIAGYETESCGNLYAYVLERVRNVICSVGMTGMIIPLSAVSTPRMDALQGFLVNGAWISSYDFRPGHLFDGVNLRLCISINAIGRHSVFTTKYNRWYSETRALLFQNLVYHGSIELREQRIAVKIASEIEKDVFTKVVAEKEDFEARIAGKYEMYFHDAILYWLRGTDFAPEYKGYLSSHVKTVSFSDEKLLVGSILKFNSSLFYWLWTVISNCRDLNVDSLFLLKSICLADEGKALVKRLMVDFVKNSKIKERNQRATGLVRYREFYPNLSKPIIDEIDELLAKHYGFTEEELDFIINYDIKYRMGDELNAE